MEAIRYIFLGEEKAKENKIILTVPKYLKGHYIKKEAQLSLKVTLNQMEKYQKAEFEHKFFF